MWMSSFKPTARPSAIAYDSTSILRPELSATSQYKKSDFSYRLALLNVKLSDITKSLISSNVATLFVLILRRVIASIISRA